jgi:hypothetical protein
MEDPDPEDEHLEQAIFLERLGWSAAGMTLDQIENEMPFATLQALLDLRAGINARERIQGQMGASGGTPGVAFGSIED